MIKESEPLGWPLCVSTQNCMLLTQKKKSLPLLLFYYPIVLFIFTLLTLFTLDSLNMAMSKMVLNPLFFLSVEMSLNPHGRFQLEIWGFISPCWSPGLRGLLPSLLFVLVYLCVSVGLWGATCHSACPVLRHSESGHLGLSVRECGAAGSASGQTACPFHRQSGSRHGHVSPLHPGCLSPPLLLVWMYVSFLSPWCQTSLLFNFLSVLVVRGGAVCLPMLPSWLQQWILLYIYL